MIINQGIDIVENDRIKKIIFLYKEKFLKKIFSVNEIYRGQLYKNIFSQKMIQKYSARFAAKEAASKALGSGISKGVKFCEIESNKPASVKISMSHEKKYSVAIVTISDGV